MAQSQDGSGNAFWRLHALDLTAGSELFGGPTTITATSPGTGGNSDGTTVTFDPKTQHERAALLESGNTIYTTWSGLYGDCSPYSGWVISYSADTLAPVSSINLTPNNGGGGMWMGGGGPAADSSGDIYVISGNGFKDTAGGATPGTPGYYGNSFVRLSGSSALSVVDFFTPSNTLNEDNADLDLGSTAPLILPDFVDAGGITRHLAVGSGKDGNIYVVERNSMGGFDASGNSNYQVLKASSGSNEIMSPAIYFNNTVYIGPVNEPIEAFSISNALLGAMPSSQTVHAFGGGTGTMPTISANGATSGIVWSLDVSGKVLFAYDATTLTELYDSNQAAASRDHFQTVGGHFVTPMVTNGRLYFGTGTTLATFGLLP